ADVDLYGDADVEIDATQYITGMGGYWESSMGRQLSGVGDSNGDGLDDFLVGAPYAEPAGSENNSGGVYLFLGQGM
ncbi:MAG: integrin alpha, partial [Myxococcota bacterium]|nr:integrin alpha [Myxococcota bacterium]